MELTTLSSKGQVIIPKAVRESHSWRPGLRLVVEDTPAGIVLRPARPFPSTSLEEGLGCVGYRGRARTVREMDLGIDAELRKRWRTGRVA